MSGRTLVARYNGRCKSCGALITRGDVIWHAGRGRTYCADCVAPSTDASADVIIRDPGEDMADRWTERGL